MADFLDQKRKEIEDRLAELRPLVDEFHRLEAAAAALAGVDGRANGSAPATPRRTRRRRSTGGGGSPASGSGSGAQGGGRRRPGRPKGSGGRAKQALEIVAAQPGISIADLAREMGIQPNYLYRVLPTLEQEGKVRKEGRGWHPAG